MPTDFIDVTRNLNKENNVFKDALGVKGLGFKHHGNHPCNHGSHYGNHHGNYHDNHSNHHGNYNAEQLLFSCQFSKVSSCQVVKLTGSCQVVTFDPWDMLNNFCFHVYAQKCQVVRLSSCQDVTLSSCKV